MIKKGILAGMLTTVMLMSFPAMAFTDLDGYEWCSDDVTYLVERDLLRGTSAETFSPGDAALRGDFAVLAVRVFGLDAENIPGNFADVLPDQYYYKSVGILKMYQIVTGIDWNHFYPQNSIIRQDMAVMLWRLMYKMGYYGQSDAATVLERYSDGAKVEPYAADAMAFLIEKGIMAGTPDGLLRPGETVTRAEMTVMMARIHRYLEHSYTN